MSKRIRKRRDRSLLERESHLTVCFASSGRIASSYHLSFCIKLKTNQFYFYRSGTRVRASLSLIYCRIAKSYPFR
ncbi:unnamed protein product [Lupinus luteus]|uniref:Uncharacterized protein n=1 Tax=Lupinus luteus TaxID=3873 RepID=A0AAV1X011_LUPLU